MLGLHYKLLYKAPLAQDSSASRVPLNTGYPSLKNLITGFTSLERERKVIWHLQIIELKFSMQPEVKPKTS
jgi:hypothetical protein